MLKKGLFVKPYILTSLNVSAGILHKDDLNNSNQPHSTLLGSYSAKLLCFNVLKRAFNIVKQSYFNILILNLLVGNKNIFDYPMCE